MNPLQTDDRTSSAVAEPLLQLRNVHKHYGQVQALRGVDLTVGSGELVALLGDNGAGKSTLVKVLSGLIRPNEGEMIWKGGPVSLASPRDAGRRGIETIYQDGALVDSMSIMRNIFMGREITNKFGFLRLREMRSRAQDILGQFVYIDGIGSPHRLVEELSGGQKQAVAIARAIYFGGDLLLLDEPTSALAAKAIDALLEHLQTLKEDGVTCVLITHNLHHAYQICDRFVVMNRGRVAFEATKEQTNVDELTQHVIGVEA